MAADFKSHILSRDEKGFGGVPFKRLLFGGIAGGFTYTLCRFALPDLAIPAGVVVALLVVILTAPRGRTGETAQPAARYRKTGWTCRVRAARRTGRGRFVGVGDVRPRP
jgi:hypothetical protein